MEFKLIKEFFSHNLFNKDIKFEEKKSNYKYNIIITPKNDDFCHDPEVFYSLVEANYLKLNFPEVDLFPFCSGGLINCLYLINVKLNFDSMITTDETISIPIELFFDNNNNNNAFNNINNNEIKISNPYSQIFKEGEDNINENLNINAINNNTNKEKDGFEVIEKEDFINTLNSKSNKK